MLPKKSSDLTRHKLKSFEKAIASVPADDVSGRAWFQLEGLPSRPLNHAQPRLFVYPEKETRDFVRSQLLRRKGLWNIFECGCVFR